jgi:hypothetical protein
VDLRRGAADRRREALVNAELDAAALVESARDAVGFEDLGDDTLADRLADLLAQLEGQIAPGVRASVDTVVHDLLVQRLSLLHDRWRHPIADEPIERPIITFGEPRSGTTLLQMLLGCDPASRLLQFWEVMRPSPPPGLGDSTERRERADEDWREILGLVPAWLVSHPYNAMLGANPPECERLWAMDLRAVTPTAWWRVPGSLFPTIRLEQDPVRQYEIHRMVLQHLQFRQSPRRWVLKGTSHQHRLDALLRAYPDAVFVWIHRDPLQTLASRFELTAQIYEALDPRFDRQAFAAAIVERGVAAFDSAANDPLAADPRIQHVTYQDFASDPFTAVHDIYDRASLTFTEELDQAMRRWSQGNPANRFGRFRYAVESLGVDVVALDAQLEPYRRRFDVPRERPKEP